MDSAGRLIHTRESMSGPVIVVDDAIAQAESALAGLGAVRRLPAAALDGATLAALGAEALVVRSVTRVDAELLDRAPRLGFVGTATAGIDHVDLEAIDARGLEFASAAGCNAQAVAEWVLAALSVVEGRLPAQLRRGPVGIVGLGQVGGRLARLLEGVGYEVLACDPPLARSGLVDGATSLVDFDTLWARCPIVSFHVPLTLTGPDATLAYLDRRAPALAGPKLLINTSRGSVLRGAALDRPDVEALILDVWDGEPRLEPARLSDPRLLLASPHVAGYSLEAKLGATRMMHEALARWLGRAPSWTGAELLAPQTLDGPMQGFDDRAAVVARVVALSVDDASVRALAELPDGARGPAFEGLRRHYRLRREFRSWQIPSARVSGSGLRAWLRCAGFSLVESDSEGRGL